MYWNWALSLKLDSTEWWWLCPHGPFLNTGLWCLFGLSSAAISFGMSLPNISMNMAEPCPRNKHPSAVLLVFFTHCVFFVYMAVLDEPLSSTQYNLLSLSSTRDAGGLKEQLLRDSWQRILPLALWLKAHDCVTHPLAWMLRGLFVNTAKYSSSERCWECSQPSSRILLVTPLWSVTSFVPATKYWHDQEVNVTVATSLLKGSWKDGRAKLSLVVGQRLWIVAWDVGKNFITGKICSPGADHQRDWENLHPWRGFKFLLDKATADLI